MAEMNNLTEQDNVQSVSALGLRWAALRGMLTSPLIMVEDQKSLREELLRELGIIERNFASAPSRNVAEISAKIDIAKSALRDGLQAGQSWLVELLESIQNDFQAALPKTQSPRSPVNLARAYQPMNEAVAPEKDDEAEEEISPAA
ncbi:hypothetical protein [Microvirga terricola]|uniref:Uncharacterized protein n=1 Tax=Microvirga terricola TaxID=2719797 RepID=A0ABX0VBI9_9HYPH|nr:hypothetical protein [Microvirga terricola]NIX75751.1 hypothetical protein [Microvirga terricola]